MAIAVDQNYDKAQRKISTANLEQFAGVDCQLLVEKETHRPIIMDGVTVGGNFKCASTDELEAVKAKADSAVSFIEQSLTTEQKAQVVQNLEGTFLPLGGGTVTGSVRFNVSTIVGYDTNEAKMLEIAGGDTWRSGSVVKLYSNSDPNAPGNFYINTGNEKVLSGLTTGSLTWDGKEIERVNAIGENYIRYESGLQICWGKVEDYISGSVIVNVPVPFINASFVKVGTVMWDTVPIPGIGFTDGSNTHFTIHKSNITSYAYWLAIGKWK